MLVRWPLTVFSLMPSRLAICLLADPSATRTRTSRSRLDNRSSGELAVRSASNSAAAFGSRGASPRAAARIGSWSTAGSTSFNR